MAGCAAQVHEPALGEQDDTSAVREDHVIDLRLDIVPLEPAQVGDVDLVIEMPDIADDGFVLHAVEVFAGDDMVIAGGSYEDVGLVADVVEQHHPVAFHRGLQGADRVDLGDAHGRAQRAQRLRTTLADVAVATDHHDLAGNHHVRGSLDAVDQGLAAAVEIVELGLGHRVVHVEGRAAQRAVLHHVVQPLHAGGRLLRQPAHVFHEFRVLVMHQDRQVAPVIEQHIRCPAVRSFDRLLNAPPVLVLRLALPGEHRHARGGDGGRRMILGREDVAR